MAKIERMATAIFILISNYTLANAQDAECNFTEVEIIAKSCAASDKETGFGHPDATCSVSIEAPEGKIFLNSTLEPKCEGSHVNRCTESRKFNKDEEDAFLREAAIGFTVTGNCRGPSGVGRNCRISAVAAGLAIPKQCYGRGVKFIF